jgi:predicted amidophosphoribosyltransferase
MTENKKICPSCSSSFESGDRFCWKCGAKIPDGDSIHESKSTTVIFYILMAVMLIAWVLSGMPMNRFWWR